MTGLDDDRREVTAGVRADDPLEFLGTAGVAPSLPQRGQR